MKRKNLIWSLVLPFVLFLFYVSCKKDENEIPIKEISINVPDLQLGLNEVSTLIVTTLPEKATTNVLWTSSNTDVAQIQYNKSGLVAGVKALKLGNTVLTAKAAGSETTQTVNLQVITKIESIALEEVFIENLAQTKYNVVFTPADASIKEVKWSSSKVDVAKVENGLVTAVAPGATLITATTIQGGKSASVEINVSGDPPILGFQYCSVSGTGSYNPDIIKTDGGGQNINNSKTQPSGNYHYYKGEKLTVVPGGSFELHVKQSNNWSMSVAWVDWNGDKDFVDEGERIALFGIQGQLNDGPFKATVNVPADADPGLVRLRVLTGDAWTTDPSKAPCAEVANSTTKDFDIEIVGKLYCKATGTGAYNADVIKTSGGETNINYTGSQPSENYEFYTAETLGVKPESSFTLELTQSNNWSRSMVWIDWNGDADFSEDELVKLFGIGSQLNDGPFNANIYVPADAVRGGIRMRIITGDAWSYDPPPKIICGEQANSTIKDFKIEIL